MRPSAPTARALLALAALCAPAGCNSDHCTEWFEGWPRIVQGVSQAGWDTWLAVLWQSYGNTIFGYGAWAWLLSRYAAASVSPMALLVPVFGMAASALLLGEGMPGWKLLAAGLVLLGLAINVLWPHLHRRWAR